MQEVAVSKPWVMANEPVDLKYDTWYPTDWLSANLRQVVSVIFSHSSNSSRNRNNSSTEASADGISSEIEQSMDVDQVSNGKLLYLENQY